MVFPWGSPHRFSTFSHLIQFKRTRTQVSSKQLVSFTKYLIDSSVELDFCREVERTVFNGKLMHHSVEDMIQDKEGGGAMAEEAFESIKWPSASSSNDIDLRNNELVNLLMEENKCLHEKLEELNKKYSDAKDANKQWSTSDENHKKHIALMELRYAKVQKDLEEEREQHKKLKDTLKDILEQRTGQEKDYQTENTWLKEELELKTHQVKYLQKELRSYERAEAFKGMELKEWQCERCTFLNPGDRETCDMCGCSVPERLLRKGNLVVD